MGHCLIKPYLINLTLKNANKYINNTSNSNFIIESNINQKFNFRNLKDRQILDIKKYSVPPLTRYEDRNSMMYGIETRHPFLDHRLIEFCLCLKDNFLIDNGWNKYILRKSFNEIPKQIRFRKDKRGFDVSHETFLRNELSHMFFELFKSSKLHENGIIDEKKLLNEFKNYKSKKSNINPAKFSGVLVSELWAREFF